MLSVKQIQNGRKRSFAFVLKSCINRHGLPLFTRLNLNIGVNSQFQTLVILCVEPRDN